MNVMIEHAPGAKLMCALSLLPALLLGTTVCYGAGDRNSGENTGAPRTASVHLGAAGHFVILSETGVTDVPSSVVTGNVGVSPITGAADLLSCAEVTGKIYSVDDAGPPPCSIMNPTKLTTAIDDMQTAYTNAAGRAPTNVNLGGGNIGGLTLQPGVYNWTTGVSIPSNITISGGKTSVWIFQIAGDLDVSTGVIVSLAGHAVAKHIFWQVAGVTNLGTSSHLEGTVLDATAINLGTSASINGRLLAQTAVSLQMNNVTRP
ncbi:MAG: ice-binding family protein [Rhizomicrobium sp.]